MEFTQKVMKSGWLAHTAVLVGLACAAAATVCPPGEQYWSPGQETCVNCTRCDVTGHVVLRPCEVHRDTVCGPVSDLDIDWALISGRAHHHRHHRKHPETRGGWQGRPAATHHADVTSTEMPFTSAESLVWDWQAVALTLAVFACILFFLVAALFSIHQARQWKRLKDNFEADVEELSARLNLMVTTGELGDQLEPNTAPITDGNYLTNHCVYLEQLLVRKDSKIGPGNVYIEESNPNSNTNTTTSKT